MFSSRRLLNLKGWNSQLFSLAYFFCFGNKVMGYLESMSK